MQKEENAKKLSQSSIDSLAKCILPEIIKFFETDEGKPEFEGLKKLNN